MVGVFDFDLREIIAEAEACTDEDRRMFELAKKRSREDWKLSKYTRYGVDNDFDLVEAMYEDLGRFTGDLLKNPKFESLRRECIMNPEYTERCLESEAFWDMKDEIMECLGNA